MFAKEDNCGRGTKYFSKLVLLGRGTQTRRDEGAVNQLRPTENLTVTIKKANSYPITG